MTFTANEHKTVIASNNNKSLARHFPHNDLPTNHTKPVSLVSSTPPTASSQLDLILAKLNELDVIKTHLNTINNRLDSLQPQPNVQGLLANRS